MIVRKVYRVFDNLFYSRKDAEMILKGWEHKERITDRYALLHSEDREESIVNGINIGIPATNAKLFKNELDAIKEMKEGE